MNENMYVDELEHAHVLLMGLSLECATILLDSEMERSLHQSNIPY